MQNMTASDVIGEMVKTVGFAHGWSNDVQFIIDKAVDVMNDVEAALPAGEPMNFDEDGNVIPGPKVTSYPEELGS